MNNNVRTLLAVAGLVAASTAAADITLYGRPDFNGQSFTADRPVANLERWGFNDRATSAVVANGRWQVCENAQFAGRCVVLAPGEYRDLKAMGLNNQVSSVRMVDDVAQITLYGRPGFGGRSLSADQPVANLARGDFNDRASSIVVNAGRWEVCEEARFNGRCVVLTPGQYPNLRAIGLNNRVSSVRMVAPERVGQGRDDRRAALVTRDEEFRQRRGERLFTVPVSSVRAVVTQSNQRCWVERQEVQSGGNGGANVAGAVVGGILGGIIGHQFGGGRGNDVATGAGAVGGALVGSNIARNNAGGSVMTQDVQRCEQVGGDVRPDYYDVVYQFRGVEHRVQMTSPPGDSITVNAEGEPRV